MKNSNPITFLFAALILFFASSNLVASGSTTHWSYQGDEGPEHWADLSADFHLCREGRNQSPIDLNQNVHADLPKLVFDYRSSPARMQQVNNGHTIKQNVEPGNFLNISSRNLSFQLLQFHFHSPSEHKINGKSYPMEVHFVHADDEGALAVVSVMFTEGAENPELAKLWAFMPENVGDSGEQAVGIEEINLLPPIQDHFYYSGSLTTPPCSEGVAWVVLKNPIEASADQLAQFYERMGQATNRPVQPHNARLILD